MRENQRDATEKQDPMERLNMYWDGVMQDPVYHFEKLSKFSLIWMIHNNNRLAGDRFDWKAWLEHEGYKETSEKRKIVAK